MKVSDFISKRAIIPDVKAKDKKGVIKELVAAIRTGADGSKISPTELTNAILDREKLGSTGIGRGVAVPHAKCKSVTRVVGAMGRSKKGIAFNAIDGEPVNLFFLILSPMDAAETYHKALQAIMHHVKKPSFLNFLLNAKSVKEINEVLQEAEEPIKV